jgi:hypothetical protein
LLRSQSTETESKVHNLINEPRAYRSILCANFKLQTSFFQNERFLDDQEIEAPRVDNSPSSHAEDTGKKENKGRKHRPVSKAD